MAETTNQLWARAVVEELVRSGLRHAVICPGSRSTPIALALAEAPALRCWSVVDERSAGFFALGIAKQSGTAAAVLATSGSAGAHFFPAVIEAAMSNVPLLLLTADRPPELHGWGAQQSIDQQRLYGSYARQFSDLGVPEARGESVLHLRATVAQAFAVAHSHPRGPVQLNAPFREPLAPEPDAPALPALSPRALHGEAERPLTRVRSPQRSVDTAALEAVRQHLASTEEGVIVAGPRDAADGLAEVVAELGRRLGYPVFAEATSNLRFGHLDSVSAVYDALVRAPAFAQAHRPKLVLRIGGAITARTVQAWVDGAAYTVQLSEDGALHDPQHTAQEILVGSPRALCEALMPDGVRASGWRARFDAAEQRVRRALAGAFEGAPQLTEPAVAFELARALPAGAQLFVSSSMPIRDLDAFAFEGAAVRTFANRGANGIDGIVSTALGVAAAAGRPTVLLTGDLALLHDLGGALAARRHRLPLTVVAVNNDGGGIFSFLPVASRTPHFEALFGTPHGIGLDQVAALANARYARCDTGEALRRELAASLEGGLNLLEVRTDRQDNVAEHRRLFALAAAAVGEEP